MAFRYLLQNWLRSTAERKIREKVIEAAEGQLRTAAEEPESRQSGQPSPASRVGVVFALGIEAGGLEDLLEGVVTTRGHGLLVRQGRLKGQELALILSGPGRRHAARATEALIAGHQPEWVVSAGFAGGLNPQLKRHDILIADHLVDTAGNQMTIDLEPGPVSPSQPSVTSPPQQAAGCQGWTSHPCPLPGVHVGRLLTADRVIRLREEKRSLLEQYGALAVDMETFAVAEVCRRRQVGFLGVRVIHDAFDEELPPDVERLLAQKTRAAQLGAAAGAIWKRPSSIKDLYKLKENALLASDRLAKFLADLIEYGMRG
jgi:adenosylhomocysteine nucleosidase